MSRQSNGGGDKQAAFDRDAKIAIQAVEAQWQNDHPDRHALVMLFDETGSARLYDSISPDEYYDCDSYAERHRLMLVWLMTLVDPGLMQALYMYLGLIDAGISLKDIKRDCGITHSLPKWMYKARNAVASLLRNESRLEKVESDEWSEL